MKYSIQNYAKALVGAIENLGTKSDAAIGKNFLAIVQKNGDEARLPKILDEAGRLARARGGAREVVIASARPLSDPQKKALHRFIKTGDIVRYVVDPDLVAGVKITVNDEMQFDGTMKAKLDEMFALST
jgi:F0F1-type ATP synthase delta subunit